MFTCTMLGHALLEWQKNKGVHPKASKSKLTANRADCLNYFNYKNDSDKNTSWCAAMGRKLLSSPGIADTYTFLMTICISKMLNGLEVITEQLSNSEQPHWSFQMLTDAPR